MWCLWSAKGGVGCTVATAAIALQQARRQEVLVVDLGGDMLSVLGRPEDGPGISHWLTAQCPPPDGLSRLERQVGPRLSVLPWGGVLPDIHGPRFVDIERPEMLARLLALDQRLVVVDIGVRRELDRPVNPAEQLLRLCSRSTLVTRPCRLAVRAAEPLDRPDDIVVIGNRRRAMRTSEVAAALGVPVAAALNWDPAVVNSAAAGLCHGRLPRSLRSLRTLGSVGSAGPAGSVGSSGSAESQAVAA